LYAPRVIAATKLDTAVGALERRLAAGSAGEDLVDPRGSWNLAQVLQHCAHSIRYSVTGYPRLGPALLRATVGPIAKRLFLRRGSMRHDLDAPLAGAPPLDPDRALADCLTDLADSVALFQASPGRAHPHPAYGRCTHREYAVLHALHLADHLPGLH
jgi:hypothetical protein